MNTRPPAYVYAIIDPSVSAQSGMTAHHQMIPDDTIMSNVTVCKKYVSRTNHGLVVCIRSKRERSRILEKHYYLQSKDQGLHPRILGRG